ncbi:MAG: hypothetical protein HC866_17295 [Leptolyngbyaceae cyanobacterium RU_5_1]|nr:hypothetical protein [Leptolyngbyaceae cyanobacterium RU_5_1]
MKNLQSSISSPPLARGSARSINHIDLYQLVAGQEHLLHRFGGHPYAAGLSLAVENIPLFTEAINQQLRQTVDVEAIAPSLQVDLVVTVKELGKELFQELKLLEPCGMGNPAPKLLIQNGWFTNVWNKKIQDRKGRKVEYIKTEFELWDDSASKGFAGVWWGHYREEIPQGRCDAVVELDFNTYVNEAKGRKPHYEVRLIAVRPCKDVIQLQSAAGKDWLLDWRGLDVAEIGATEPQRHKDIKISVENSSSLHPFIASPPFVVRRCPSSWTELQVCFRQAQQNQQKLAIAYPPPPSTSALEAWEKLVGIAKYLSRTGKTVTRQQLLEKLEIGDRTLQLGFKTLELLGFELSYQGNGFWIHWHAQEGGERSHSQLSEVVEQFLVAIKEEQFRRQYFFQVPLETIQAMVR